MRECLGAEVRTSRNDLRHVRVENASAEQNPRDKQSLLVLARVGVLVVLGVEETAKYSMRRLFSR